MAVMRVDALAFGPHPDDVELTCAGTLIRLKESGYSTAVVAVTAGELGTRGSAATRAAEFQKAAQAMQLDYSRILGIPDGAISDSFEYKLEVIREIRRCCPRIVFAPYWIDRHPDHVNASKLVSEAAFLSGLRKIDTGQPAFRPHRVLFYPCRDEFKPSFVVDISAHHERKLEAIRCYASQFHNPQESFSGEPQTNISRPHFLEAVITRARQYGSYVGCEYGEPFLVREPMRLDDPVAFFGPEYLNSYL